MARGEWLRLKDGTVVHVLYSGPARRRSCACGGHATLQCDFPLLFGETCDKFLCRKCAVSQGPDIDYCPSHVTKEAGS